ncbi:MAG: type II toxin-antitoxin system PemK/MazF family toxin [Bdellovibrionaceae bacterium]|nr:type II toxin-antitoxin system PemK/MazF family toxin [Pseudobdellovibrionaceae bacterium]
MAATQNPDPKRGEIWMVNFSPQVGDEIKKPRPAVVLNLPVFQTFQLRLVAPLTGWKPEFQNRWTKVMIRPSQQNGLTKDSAVDVHQTRCVSLQRFSNKLGIMEARVLQLVAETIAAYVGVK